jgi:hypothetical protein
VDRYAIIRGKIPIEPVKKKVLTRITREFLQNDQGGFDLDINGLMDGDPTPVFIDHITRGMQPIYELRTPYLVLHFESESWEFIHLVGRIAAPLYTIAVTANKLVEMPIDLKKALHNILKQEKIQQVTLIIEDNTQSSLRIGMVLTPGRAISR